MSEHISVATIDDIALLLQLINNAYRGQEAKKGWTHEADLIEGTKRTDEASLKELIQKPNAVILKYQQNEKIVGCVYLEKKGSKLYLGMLSVLPEIQAQGIGKKLMKAADEYAEQNNCNTIEMTVISVRKELIACYERNGFKYTGKKEPFPEDGKFGNPRQQLEFIYLEKML
ncbi:MAG TPA: GNAT family N-acetyltransferase [Flavisolibacter sp.]|jgi:ribosomal protein S18 acetylase RimI-like enzyme|nr:GNAT family N-acetyltransferase [Flavisolibacter sp.]